MEAIADDKTIRFVVGSEHYDVLCAAPVLDLPGSWYLWVRYEPTPKSEPNTMRAQGTTSVLELFVR
jgi:hypothetical protein